MNHDTIFHYTAVLELPFLIATVVFAFLVAGKLKGGEFGKGMLLIAWGGIGHGCRSHPHAMGNVHRS